MYACMYMKNIYEKNVIKLNYMERVYMMKYTELNPLYNDNLG